MTGIAHTIIAYLLSVWFTECRYDNPLFDAFVAAGQQAGYAFTPDLNGYRQEGFGPMHMTVRQNGARASASECYLYGAPGGESGAEAGGAGSGREVAAQRPNLDVRTGCRITRVLIEEGGEGGTGEWQPAGSMNNLQQCEEPYYLRPFIRRTTYLPSLLGSAAYPRAD